MGDQRGEVDRGRPRPARSPGAGRSRPSGGSMAATAPCGGRLRPGTSSGRRRDADEDDPPAGPDRRDRVGERVVVAGDLEGDVDRLRRATPPAAGRSSPLGRPRTRRVAPSARSRGDPMGQPVGGDDDRRAGQAQDLDEQQPERSAAVDAGPAARRDRREIERVERDAERLEQGGLSSADRVRQRVEQMARPGHDRAERAVGARRSPANRSRCRCSSRPRRHGSHRPHGSAGSATTRSPGPRPVDDHAAELVAEDERPRSASASPMLPSSIPVEVRAAQADGRDPDEDLASARRRRGSRCDPDVTRAVQPRDLGDRRRRRRSSPPLPVVGVRAVLAPVVALEQRRRPSAWRSGRGPASGWPSPRRPRARSRCRPPQPDPRPR